jgi:hypothetical protein
MMKGGIFFKGDIGMKILYYTHYSKPLVVDPFPDRIFPSEDLAAVSLMMQASVLSVLNPLKNFCR